MVLIAIVVAVYGLIVGSFLNALIWRIHEKKSIVRGRSICPNCKHQLRVVDLIPVLSWLLLGGKCRDCRQPISIQYPAVELATAGLFGLSYVMLRPSTLASWVGLLFWLFYANCFMVLVVYDWRWMRLPDAVIKPAVVVAVLQIAVSYVWGGTMRMVLGPVLAAVVFGGSFYILAAVGRGKWMGGGDIKLVFLLGLVLGIQKTALAVFLAFLGGGIVGLALILSRRQNRPRYLPFGPFLIGAAFTARFWGTVLINWYIHLSGLR